MDVSRELQPVSVVHYVSHASSHNPAADHDPPFDPPAAGGRACAARGPAAEEGALEQLPVLGSGGIQVGAETICCLSSTLHAVLFQSKLSHSHAAGPASDLLLMTLLTYNRFPWRLCRLSTAVARPDVQVVTHLCYSSFEDILQAVDDMDGELLHSAQGSRPGKVQMVWRRLLEGILGLKNPALALVLPLMSVVCLTLICPWLLQLTCSPLRTRALGTRWCGLCPKLITARIWALACMMFTPQWCRQCSGLWTRLRRLYRLASSSR